MQPGQESEELGLNQSAKGCIRCARTGGQCLAHSLRTGRLGLVPACVQPLPVGLDAGNEAKWTPVEVGRSDNKKWGEYGGKQEACEMRGMFEKAIENERKYLDIIIKRAGKDRNGKKH